MTKTTTSTLPLRAGTWALDTNHSTVGFAIRHLGVAKVRGRFTDFETDIVVGDTLENTSITATVQLASVDTGNSDRDAHVQAEDLLHVAQRPTMTFRSTRVSGEGDDWSVEGELTIGDVTKPLTLAVEFGGVEEFPGGGPRHAGFEATGEIRRTDFGIAPQFPAAMLGDVVKIQLDLELLEPEA
jgi:polyisoprenoid-binding protein YceI